MGPALDRHVALIGFMGAGKTSLGEELARRLERPFVDVDRAIEREAGASVAELFEQQGEDHFRLLEENAAVESLDARPASVVALGGGAVQSERVCAALARDALTVLVEVEPEEAWPRVAGTRPLAQDEAAFHRVYEERRPVYERTADVSARDADGLVLAAAAVHVQVGALELLGELVPGDGPVALTADATVAGIHGATAQLALGGRLTQAHELPGGEEAKTLAACERLWRELGLEREGTLAALGGGATTDTAGFVAATFMRGLPWVAVPTTLVGQVDAGIGGKTGVNLPEAKNLVGAFHWPVRTVIDAALLETLPATERLNGTAEVVKTGLLAGESPWELPEHEQVRFCAAYKAAVCLRDPYDRGPRAELNLGHTFAHALEAASDYGIPHGQAVALGLLAALRLSGLPTDVVEQTLRPRPVRVDRERAWAALLRDKKGVGGLPRLVLLDRPGAPRIGVELAPGEVRGALDSLIAA